jgi:preprotein translocase subunit SecG
MNNIALIAQSIVSVIIVILILLQQRGTALGSAFGGGGESYSTRRGAQKNIFWMTVILTVVFLGLAIYNLIK